MKNNPTIKLNELILLSLEALETGDVESKISLMKALCSLVKVIDADFVHIFKANVAINLLADSIQAELDQIKSALFKAA